MIPNKKNESATTAGDQNQPTTPPDKTPFDLSFEALQGYLNDRFPDHTPEDSEDVSELLEELQELGCTSLNQLDSFRQQVPIALKIEKEIFVGSSAKGFNSAGFMRLLLDLGSEAYRRYRNDPEHPYWKLVNRYLPL